MIGQAAAARGPVAGATGASPSRLRLLLPAAAAFLLHAACGGRYGLFRDELYFVACGQRLAWGYVDEPPLIALLARGAHALFGLWTPGLRLLPWLAAAATVWLAGRLAVALGAGARGALAAQLATLASPVLLALGHLLTMNAFEPLLWTALALALVRTVGQADGRGWPVAGLLVGIGLLDKYSMGYFAACLGLAILLLPERRSLRDRRFLAGVALALGLALPNLAWQAAHGFPFLELVRNGQRWKNAPFTPGAFARSALLESSPLLFPAWAGGLAWLLAARRARPVRFLGLGALLLVAFLVASRGKSYYLAPVYPALFAAAGAGAEALLSRPLARAAAPALAALSLLLAPLAIPLLPEERLVAWQAALGARPPRLERLAESALPQTFADQHGWPELARTVAEAASRLTPAERARAVVFGQNYGEAAAVGLYGRALGLDLPPVVSGHNQYWLWGVPAGRGDVALVVGDEKEDCGGFYRTRIRAAARPHDPWVMPYEDARVVWICRDPVRPLAEIWPRLRLYI